MHGILVREVSGFDVDASAGEEERCPDVYVTMAEEWSVPVLVRVVGMVFQCVGRQGEVKDPAPYLCWQGGKEWT